MRVSFEAWCTLPARRGGPALGGWCFTILPELRLSMHAYAGSAYLCFGWLFWRGDASFDWDVPDEQARVVS